MRIHRPRIAIQYMNCFHLELFLIHNELALVACKGAKCYVLDKELQILYTVFFLSFCVIYPHSYNSRLLYNYY